jgi:hypothetical protein
VGQIKDRNILMSVHTEDGKERDRPKKIFAKAAPRIIEALFDAIVRILFTSRVFRHRIRP